MKHLYRVLAGVTMVVGLSSQAAAATIATPVIFPGPGDALECVANNVGGTTISTVTVSIVSTANIVLDTTVCTPLVASDYCFAGVTTTTGGYCRVTYTGALRNVRAAITLTGATGEPKVALPAD